MAQSTEGSLLEKILQSRYPLTNYLYRQQQFIKVHSTTPCTTVSAPPSVVAEPTTIVTHKRKTPLPPLSCFNVPDTLDFNASEYEMDQGSGIDDDAIQDFDETLLKSIGNRIHDRTSDKKNAAYIQRSSAIQLEFSPNEHNSPVERAIQSGLQILNK